MLAAPVLLALCIVVLFLWSRWNLRPGEPDELGSKPEYSILQGFEYDYRERPNDAPIRFRRHAMQSPSDVIGFPVAGRSTGYVWYIANPRVIPAISPMPDDVEPRIPAGAVHFLQSRVRLDPALAVELRRREQPSPIR